MTRSILLGLSGLTFLAGPAPTPPAPMVEGAARVCNEGVTVERTAWLMGTALRAVACGPSREASVSAIGRAFAAVAETEKRLSTWRDDSELSRLNAAAVGSWVSVSPATAATLREVRVWSALTDGAFDPAVGAAMIARGLRPDLVGASGEDPGGVREADASGLGGGAGLPGWEVDVSAPRARRLRDVRLDAGGFGKGAGLEAALAAIGSRSVRWVELDFGGQIAWRSFGRRASEVLAVEVAHPRHRHQPAGRLEVEASHVATTSASERYVEDGAGRRVGHVLDPRSGEPVDAWGSVTVASDDALVADVLSTALFVMGPDAALRWSATQSGVGVLLLELNRNDALRVRTSGLGDHGSFTGRGDLTIYFTD